jgi:hypothetical protein
MRTSAGSVELLRRRWSLGLRISGLHGYVLAPSLCTKMTEKVRLIA